MNKPTRKLRVRNLEIERVITGKTVDRLRSAYRKDFDCLTYEERLNLMASLAHDLQMNYPQVA